MTRLRLVIVLVLSVVVLSGALIYRAHQTATTDRKLCDVMHELIAKNGATIGKKGTPGFAYYQEHPDELKAARRQNRGWLKQLDCDHLPSGG